MSEPKNRRERYLSIREICDRFGVSAPTIYRLVGEGRLPEPVRLGQNARWPEHEFEAAIAALPRGLSGGRPRKFSA